MMKVGKDLLWSLSGAVGISTTAFPLAGIGTVAVLKKRAGPAKPVVRYAVSFILLLPLNPVKNNFAFESGGTLLWPGSVLGPKTRIPGLWGWIRVRVWR
jgi:hypothetical protein